MFNATQGAVRRVSSPRMGFFQHDRIMLSFVEPHKTIKEEKRGGHAGVLLNPALA